MFFKKKKNQEPDQRSNWSAWESLFASKKIIGKPLTNAESLTISAVYRCVAVLSDSISTLPAILYKNKPDGGKERAVTHNLYKKLKLKPNSRQRSVDFYKQIMLSLTMRGNAYIHKIYSSSGLLELYCLMPDRVSVKELTTGELEYSFRLASGSTYVFKPFEILHIRGLSFNGIMGLSPIDLASQTFAVSKAAEEHGASFFSNGIQPNGVLTHPSKLTKEAADRLRKSFNDTYSGSGNANKTMVLEEGMQWQQLSLTNEQSQFIQTRQFETIEICRWFGVPPHKVFDLTRSTYSNIEHQSLEFINDSLRPWMINIEQAFLTDLFSESEWANYTFEFLVDAYLRGDTLSRYQAYQIGINNGILNLDEVRVMENRNPLPDDLGKEHYMPLNLSTVKNINISKEQGQKDNQQQQEPVQQEHVDTIDDSSQDNSDSVRMLANDIISRVNRRANKGNQENKLDIAKFTEAAKRDLNNIQLAFKIDDVNWQQRFDFYVYEVNNGKILEDSEVYKILLG